MSIIKRQIALLGVEATFGLLVSGVKLEGRENLQKSKELQDGGKPLFIMANHLSNLDGPLVYKILEKEGFREPVFVVGIKLLRNPMTKFLVDRVRYILVWPPSPEPRNIEEKKEKSRINQRAYRDSRRVVNEGFEIVIFPEGTRSRTGYLGEGITEVAAYVEHYSDAVILPVALIDTDKRIPVGIPEIRRPLSVFKLTRGPVGVRVGQPIQVSDLSERFCQLSKGEKREMSMKYVMGRIGELLPPRHIKSARIIDN